VGGSGISRSQLSLLMETRDVKSPSLSSSSSPSLFSAISGPSVAPLSPSDERAIIDNLLEIVKKLETFKRKPVEQMMAEMMSYLSLVGLDHVTQSQLLDLIKNRSQLLEIRTILRTTVGGTSDLIPVSSHPSSNTASKSSTTSESNVNGSLKSSPSMSPLSQSQHQQNTTIVTTKKEESFVSRMTMIQFFRLLPPNLEFARENTGLLKIFFHVNFKLMELLETENNKNDGGGGSVKNTIKLEIPVLTSIAPLNAWTDCMDMYNTQGFITGIYHRKGENEHGFLRIQFQQK
jgi:hypothetical protein